MPVMTRYLSAIHARLGTFGVKAPLYARIPGCPGTHHGKGLGHIRRIDPLQRISVSAQRGHHRADVLQHHPDVRVLG